MLYAILFFIVLYVIKGSICSGSFEYDSQSQFGPDKWGQEYKQCFGKLQSPINIDDEFVTRAKFKALTFYGLRQLPWAISITNDGHSVVMKIKSKNMIKLEGGPLKGNYTFDNLHFHWGENDTLGSENTINNKSFPMEVHMVFYKSKFKSKESAMRHNDSLAVLAIFPEVSQQKNLAYAELVDSLKSVNEPEKETNLPYPLPIEYLLPDDREHYYTYKGSLTTPPCLEIVTWIEFIQPISLSHNQLEEFRRLTLTSESTHHNHRPTQPSHGRKVYFNVRNNAYRTTNSLLLLIILLILKF